MRSTKLLIIFLVLLISIGLFFGCTKKNNQNIDENNVTEVIIDDTITDTNNIDAVTSSDSNILVTFSDFDANSMTSQIIDTWGGGITGLEYRIDYSFSIDINALPKNIDDFDILVSCTLTDEKGFTIGTPSDNYIPGNILRVGKKLYSNNCGVATIQGKYDTKVTVSVGDKVLQEFSKSVLAGITSYPIEKKIDANFVNFTTECSIGTIVANYDLKIENKGNSEVLGYFVQKTFFSIDNGSTWTKTNQDWCLANDGSGLNCPPTHMLYLNPTDITSLIYPVEGDSALDVGTEPNKVKFVFTFIDTEGSNLGSFESPIFTACPEWGSE